MERGKKLKFSVVLKLLSALALTVLLAIFRNHLSHVDQAFATENSSQTVKQKKPRKIILEIDNDRRAEKEQISNLQQTTDENISPIVIKAPKNDQSLTLVTLIGSIMLGTGIVFGLPNLKRKYFSKRD